MVDNEGHSTAAARSLVVIQSNTNRFAESPHVPQPLRHRTTAHFVSYGHDVLRRTLVSYPRRFYAIRSYRPCKCHNLPPEGTRLGEAQEGYAQER